MKRFVKQMAAFVMMVFAVACVKIDDIELSKPTNALGSDSGVVTISPRISHYTDCDVSTRSAKEGDEAKVTSMAMALFPISDEGEIQPCVYYQYNGDGNMLFVLDRNKAPFTDSDEKEPYIDHKFVMYVIANMQESGIPKNSGYVTEEGKIAVYQSDGSVTIMEDKDENCGAKWTTEDFIKKAHTIKNNECFEKIHENGLPMLGMLGDTFNEYGDGNIFIFDPTKGEGNTNGLPMIDSTPKDGVDNFIPTDNLEIPMRSLYAKFSFTIGVDSNQEIVGNASPRFDLIGYKVVNAPGTVYLSREMNEDNNAIDYEGDLDYNDVVDSEFHNVAIEGLYAQGATKATFTFYVPERTLEPENSPDEYTYYLGENGAGIKGYDNIPKDMQKYAQRFKPELVGEGQKATHVEVKGTFTDHQSHVYDVTYKIYLGKDNYGDFNIIRNTHYNNFITIKGIDNSDDESVNYDPDDPDAIAPISIDHRVSIERTTPLVIGLRRETQLDAHFEVRPLRLHLSGGTDPSKTVIVSLRKAKEKDPELNTWIGMEWKDAADAGDQTYCTSGKRKYFTTDLVGSLGGAKSIKIDNLSETEYSTIWIYVDENDGTSNRSAILSTSYTYGGETFTDDYVITQHGLYKVTNGDRTYYIENFEEYLYNYDIEDVYGQTKDEGMPWGLPGVQLSNEHQSFTINEDNQTWKDYIAKNPTIVTYDFYTWEQDSLVMKNAGIDKQNDKRWHEYAGQHFTSDIYKKSNGEVRYLAMDQSARGAVEYCYSKNKKNTDGSVDVKWYLPSAGELEDFIVAAYSSFEEFQDNYYWTSQPAYTRNAFYYEFKKSSGFLGLGSTTVDTYAFIVYEDNTDYARATKVKSLGNDKYGYASSGLNDEPKERGTFNNAVYDSGTPRDTLGYFKTWYQWKKPAIGSATTTPEFTDQWYWDMKDEKPTERLYYAFVNENYFNPEYNFGMLQEGYQLRTKKNRVRCAYKSN